jgi:hypothetical protein
MICYIHSSCICLSTSPNIRARYTFISITKAIVFFRISSNLLKLICLSNFRKPKSPLHIKSVNSTFFPCSKWSSPRRNSGCFFAKRITIVEDFIETQTRFTKMNSSYQLPWNSSFFSYFFVALFVCKNRCTCR